MTQFILPFFSNNPIEESGIYSLNYLVNSNITILLIPQKLIFYA